MDNPMSLNAPNQDKLTLTKKLKSSQQASNSNDTTQKRTLNKTIMGQNQSYNINIDYLGGNVSSDRTLVSARRISRRMSVRGKRPQSSRTRKKKKQSEEIIPKVAKKDIYHTNLEQREKHKHGGCGGRRCFDDFKKTSHLFQA